MKENTEAEWAEFLCMRVYFDLCGFPTVLRSDRGPEFTGAVVKAINDLLGVDHAFGSSYHPESQGYIESRHKPVNTTLAAYAKSNPGKWARRVKLCQWAMRATPRADRDNKSPFEIITGLKPQGPLNRVFEKVSPTTLSPAAYVRDLCEALEKTQNDVSLQLSADYAKKRSKGERELTSEWLPGVGDTVLLRKPPAEAVRAAQDTGGGIADRVRVSSRLQPLTDQRPFVVKKIVGSKSYILADADSGSTELGFSQPVALSRLVPFDLCQLETPVNPDDELWIDIKSNLPGRADRWLCRRISGQQATGAVRLTSADGAHEEVVDLADYEWRWRALPPSRVSGQTAAVAVFGKYDPKKRDRNSPFAHPAPGDTKGWTELLVPLYRKYAPKEVDNVPKMLEKYRGSERAIYRAFLEDHEGMCSVGNDVRLLGKKQCRICLRVGHWGNECPDRKKPIG